MANRQTTFLIKRSNVPGKVPPSSGLTSGELALNTADAILYTSGSTANEILPIGWDRIHRTGDTVSGDFLFNGDIQISGSTQPSGYTLSVTGDTNLGGDVFVQGDLYYSGSVLVTGSTIIQDGLTANTIYTDYIDFNQNYTGATTQGRINWDTGTGTLNVGIGDTTTGLIDLQVGQEEVVRVYNSESTTLLKGEIVYVSGSQGNRPTVKRASAINDGYSVTTLGMVSRDILSGNEGYVTTFGIISNLNTLGLTGGTAIWLSPTTPGGYTETKPQAPYHTVLIGYVVRVSATVGSIFINISNGWELDELHDVRISAATEGDLLVRSSFSGSPVWVNTKTLPGNYTITGNTTIGGGLTANTISATTYQNLPVTGATSVGTGLTIFDSVVNRNIQINSITADTTEKITTTLNSNTIELGINEQNLTLWDLVVQGNRLLSGNVSYISGLTFNVSPLEYLINGTIYEITSATTVTLNSGDSLYNRIDVIFADISGNTGVLEGTPSENPEKPVVDGDSQVEVTFVLIPANSLTPDINQFVIYDEGVGPPNEWTFGSLGLVPTRITSGNFGVAYSGNTYIRVSGLTGNYTTSFRLTGSTVLDTNQYATLQFAIRNLSANTTSSEIRLRFLTTGGTQNGNVVYMNAAGSAGFVQYSSSNVSSWQLISIPLWRFYLTNTNVQVLEVSFNPIGSGAQSRYYFDLFEFVDGASSSPPSNSWTTIKGDSTTTITAPNPNATLTISGGTNISSSISGTSTVVLNLDNNINLNGVTANTISATTYQNLPNSLTGLYLPTSGGTVSGSTIFTQNITVTGGTGINRFSGNTSSDLVRITQTGTGNSFVVEDDTTTDTSPFVINSSGNVGIGTTSPDTLLEILSNNGSTVNGVLRFRDTDTVVTSLTEQFIGKIEFFSQENSGGGTGVKSYIAGIQDASANSSIVFATTGGTGTLTGSATTIIGERMRINSTGNVGIGTTSPSEKLQVSGNVLISSTLSANTISATTYQNLPNSLTGLYLPTSGGTVSGNTIFTQNISVTGGTGINWFSGDTSTDLLRVTQTGTGNAFVVEDSTNPDNTPFVITSGGSTFIGTLTGYTSAGGVVTKFQVSDGNSGVVFSGLPNVTTAIFQSDLGTNIGLLTPDATNSQIYFGTPLDAFGAYLRWDYTNRNLTLSTANSTGKIIFNTNNSVEAARIDQNGNFGIGLTGATQKLEVSGNTIIYGAYSAITTSGVNWISGDTSTDLLRVTQTGTGNAFVVEDSTNPDTTPFIINSAGTTNIGSTNVYTDSSNLAAKLQVSNGVFGGSLSGLVSSTTAIIQANTTNSLGLLSPNASTSTLYFGTPSDVYGSIMQWQYTSKRLYFGTQSSNGQIRFTTDNGVERVIFDENGNVGVGTLTPTEKLQVSGNTLVNGTLSAQTITITNTPTSGYTTTQILMRNSSTGDVEITDSTSPSIYNYGMSYAMTTFNYLT